MKFKTYLTEAKSTQSRLRNRKFSTADIEKVYEMGQEDAEMGHPRMRNFDPRSLDRPIQSALKSAGLSGDDIQKLYDAGYSDQKKNRWDSYEQIDKILKNKE